MKSMVFISGATGGLGKAFAVECASRGWNLFLTDLHADQLAILSKGLQNTYGVEVRFQDCDLTDLSSRSHLFDSLQSEKLRFWALINVAGVDFEGLFSEQTREAIRTIIRLNIEATLDVTHELLERMDPSRPFRIINVASLAAFYPMPVKATYAASKRFLVDFSMALSDEVRRRGATVTVLCPAGMPTTPGCIEGIEVQGLMGQLTTQNIGTVAARTLNYALKGRPVVIPGLLNRLLQLAGGLVPPGRLANMIGKRWRAAHRERLQAGNAEAEASPAKLASLPG
jgi:short-subunit dehydrogenase